MQCSRVRKTASVSRAPKILSRALEISQPIPTSKGSKSETPDLSNSVAMPSNVCFPAFSGGCGDIWLGIWQSLDGKEINVAVRELRTRNLKYNVLEKFRREVERWKDLQHPNIVRLLGAVTQLGPYGLTGMVSPWMQNGNLNDYLQKTQLSIHERFELLSDVTNALTYLHDQDIIHGNLTGTNILIDGEGVARLIGCGFSAADAEIEGAAQAGAAMRWRAPELLPTMDADLYTFIPTFTSACDIYSFGNVTLQMLSGQLPYPNMKSSDCVLLTVAHGIRPCRPKDADFIDPYWEFICWCWGKAREPSSRPCIGQVRDALRVLRD